MNKFNKLYKLILQSIINQNKASRAKLLAVVPHNAKIIKFLDSLNNNKLADLLATFFHYGQLESIDDYRIQQVKEIINKVSSIDIQKENDLETFLQKYQEIIAKKELKDSVMDLDKIPEFSQKKEYDHGIVVYRVEDSKAGQAAVRKIVDAHWGVNANPWCIISRKRGQNAWAYWQGYSAYPKHIAFQNGKLIAFSANDCEETVWWDRQDDWYAAIRLGKGNYVETQKYQWTPEQKKERLIQRESLEYNKQTGRYDSYNDVEVYECDLANKELPLQFGQIDGQIILDCESLKTFKGFPTYINDPDILKVTKFYDYFIVLDLQNDTTDLNQYIKDLQKKYKEKHHIKGR